MVKVWESSSRKVSLPLDGGTSVGSFLRSVAKRLNLDPSILSVQILNAPGEEGVDEDGNKLPREAEAGEKFVLILASCHTVQVSCSSTFPTFIPSSFLFFCHLLTFPPGEKKWGTIPRF